MRHGTPDHRSGRSWPSPRKRLRLEPVDPALEVGQLVLRLAGEQVDEATLDTLALEERVVDLLSDRHLDPVARGQGEGRVDGIGTLGHATQVRLHVLPRSTLGQVVAQAMVAGQRW